MNDTTTSLLTEHFSYTPLSLIDDIINSINNLVYQAITSLETGLLSTPPERLGFSHATDGSTIPDTDEDGNVVYPEARLEIENGLHQLETLLEATVDKAFDKFEIYVLRNILTVQEDLIGWVRLKHYENLVFGDALRDAPTPETILAQRRKLHETRKLNRSLKQEVARNDAIISQLRAMLSATKAVATAKSVNGAEESVPRPGGQSEDGLSLDLSFLMNSEAARQLRVGAVSGSNTHHTPLTTNTTFILSQLPALQGMVKQLQPKLAGLSNPTEAVAVDEKKNERKEYIESRVRLHLERSGQLNVDGGAHHLLGGRKFDVSEAQSLESIARLATAFAGGDQNSE